MGRKWIGELGYLAFPILGIPVSYVTGMETACCFYHLQQGKFLKLAHPVPKHPIQLLLPLVFGFVCALEANQQQVSLKNVAN